MNGILNFCWYNFYIHTQVSVPDLKKTINELRIMIILMSGDRLYLLVVWVLEKLTVFKGLPFSSSKTGIAQSSRKFRGYRRLAALLGVTVVAIWA